MFETRTIVTVGVDVGSTTAKVVTLDAGGALVEARVVRHRGEPEKVVDDLLRTISSQTPQATPIAYTGSIGVALAMSRGLPCLHEVEAVVSATRARRPGTRTIIELGGQDAKIVGLVTASGQIDARMNDRCAAGTGATLDRAGVRLGLDETARSRVRDVGDLEVAARCGVFAETDLVDLVKRGASTEDAFAALLRAIVAQNLAVLARGRILHAPVLLLGGPHAHLPGLAEAWRTALAREWNARGSEPGPVEVPEHAELFAALGAAAHALRVPTSSVPMVRGLVGGGVRVSAVRPPTLAEQQELSICTAPPSVDAPRPGRVRAALGIDAGSTTSKAVLLDEAGSVIASAYGPSQGSPVEAARDRVRGLVDELRSRGSELEIVSTGVTGWGAALAARVLGADARVVETTAHALAARRVMPDVEVVVDVGGTDVKVLRLCDEAIAELHVSSQCAAGHGAFIEATAADLGVPLAEIGACALTARRAPQFAVGCAVFMDSDRVSFVRDGFAPAEILAGLANALARNVWEHVVTVPPERLGTAFLLTGGVQRNAAAALAQLRYLRERVPGARVQVHPTPELCGAIGAAIAGARARSGAERSKFVPIEDLAAIRVATRSGGATRCDRCELSCARSVVDVDRSDGEHETFVLGNACERGASVQPSARRTTAHATDLVDLEARALFEPAAPPPDVPALVDAPVIAIPRVMGMYRAAPLLLHYLRGAGVPDDHVIVGPVTSQALTREGSRWGSTDPCFPSKVVLAHVDWLLRHRAERPFDVLLMPAITHAAVDVRGISDSASCPIVAASGHTTIAALRAGGAPLSELGIEVLTPEICLYSPERVDAQLFAAFGPLLGIDRATHERALAYSRAACGALRARLLRSGRKALDRAARDGRPSVVLLARPYHLDPGIQHGISTELAARGVTVLGISSLPRDDESLSDLSTVLPAVTNSGCAEKVWAARVVAATPGLYALDLSSFRCGQDASVYGVLAALLEEARKPWLALHDLDEDRPAASLALRVDTFVEAIGADLAQRAGWRRSEVA